MVLPNGTYPVIVVSGDAMSRNHTNHLIIEGTAVTDPDPATGASYELGDFDGYAVTVTVTDGALTITSGVGAFDPTLCFVEIGAAGSSIDAAAQTRLDNLVEQMTSATYAAQAPSVARRQYVWGEYVDELVLFKNGAEKFYAHANHLYSVAAMTDATGAVVERYSYTAYGKRTVLDPDGKTIRIVSSYGNERAWEGKHLDSETGNMHFINREYNLTLGRFLTRNGYMERTGWEYTSPSWPYLSIELHFIMGGNSGNEYVDGYSLYLGGVGAYQVLDLDGQPRQGREGNSPRPGTEPRPQTPGGRAKPLARKSEVIPDDIFLAASERAKPLDQTHLPHCIAVCLTSKKYGQFPWGGPLISQGAAFGGQIMEVHAWITGDGVADWDDVIANQAGASCVWSAESCFCCCAKTLGFMDKNACCE